MTKTGKLIKFHTAINAKNEATEYATLQELDNEGLILDYFRVNITGFQKAARENGKELQPGDIVEINGNVSSKKTIKDGNEYINKFLSVISAKLIKKAEFDKVETPKYTF